MAKILIAEDNDGFRMLTDLVLSADHHQVDAVADGREVLEYLKSETPELIILDIDMPILDGFSVCRRIKHISRLKRIPVVMLTASAAFGNEHKAKEAGAEYLLRKPLFGKDFRHFISQVLRGEAGELARPLN